MNHNYHQFVVIFERLGVLERALFLDFEKANAFATKYHGTLMGLVEVPLNDIIKVQNEI